LFGSVRTDILPTGSPLGATIGYMLVQHMAQLGFKVIDSVVVFRDVDEQDSPLMQLLFKIKDAEVPEPDPMIIDTRAIRGARAGNYKGGLRVR
jgi:hypothetical protein